LTDSTTDTRSETDKSILVADKSFIITNPCSCLTDSTTDTRSETDKSILYYNESL